MDKDAVFDKMRGAMTAQRFLRHGNRMAGDLVESGV